jgi:hypothetical protein
MRHHDCLWRIYRLILPEKPTNEPTESTIEPEESTIEPGWTTNEPDFCEGTRGGRMTQALLFSPCVTMR